VQTLRQPSSKKQKEMCVQDALFRGSLSASKQTLVRFHWNMNMDQRRLNEPKNKMQP